MDDLEDLKYELANATTHISTGYIAPPWEELAYIDDNMTIYFEVLEDRKQVEEKLRNIPWDHYRLLANRAENLLKNVRL